MMIIIRSCIFFGSLLSLSFVMVSSARNSRFAHEIMFAFIMYGHVNHT